MCSMYYSKTNPVEIEFMRINGILKCSIPSCLNKVATGMYCDDCQLYDINTEFKPKRGQIVNYEGKAYYCVPAGNVYLYTNKGELGMTERAERVLASRFKNLSRPTIDSIERLLSDERIRKQESKRLYDLQTEKERNLNAYLKSMHTNVDADVDSDNEN